MAPLPENRERVVLLFLQLPERILPVRPGQLDFFAVAVTSKLSDLHSGVKLSAQRVIVEQGWSGVQPPWVEWVAGSLGRSSWGVAGMGAY
jgi:hypothetical protein